MRRPIVPCACLLALITGAWFGQAYSLFAPLAPMASPVIVDNRATDAEFAVRAFYDGVKRFFATGDAAGIREIVAENFVDQVRPPDSGSGRELTLVERGALTLHVDAGTPWARQPNGRATTIAGTTEVEAGLGLTIPAGAVVSYRNDASTPLALFVVTVHVAS